MGRIKYVLLAIFFALSTATSMAASVQRCCPDPACDIVHCIEMECVSAAPAFLVNQARRSQWWRR
ncbi:MAG: hypothetical protein V4754_11990 [Pseudomonadota bacterium]